MCWQLLVQSHFCLSTHFWWLNPCSHLQSGQVHGLRAMNAGYWTPKPILFITGKTVSFHICIWHWKVLRQVHRLYLMWASQTNLEGRLGGCYHRRVKKSKLRKVEWPIPSHPARPGAEMGTEHCSWDTDLRSWFMVNLTLRSCLMNMNSVLPGGSFLGVSTEKWAGKTRGSRDGTCRVQCLLWRDHPQAPVELMHLI
jgi:hypothetical protein